MKKSFVNFKAGTRSSKLALIQTRNTLDNITKILPDTSFDIVEFSSPGDRDHQSDLRTSAPDFFTHDLDDAIRSSEIDFAVHSAKDLPNPIPNGIDWFWLPWHEDPRDAIILPQGLDMNNLTQTPVVGISSERRETWCKTHFPTAKIKNIRGNILERLTKLDAGEYDMLIMAGAALLRLDLANRITQWIPTEELNPPDGQGRLAITFRANDDRLMHIRGLFVNSVFFVGAGIGSADMCTLAGIKSLQKCEVCMHDSLMPSALLDYLPTNALRIDVGKRCGEHRMDQDSITDLITVHARRGNRIVRLKGGDPGIFGRLAEEVEALDKLKLPYRVIPGISSLSMATTATGMLITRREVARGFCVMTPRQKGGGLASIKTDTRKALPIVFFMAGQAIQEVATQLIEDGTPPSTPSAIVYSAGTYEERIVKSTLAECSEAHSKTPSSIDKVDLSAPPALFIVGDITQYTFEHHGPLKGKHVLLTCSEALQDKAARHVSDLGGVPLSFPLIKLKITTDAKKHSRHLEQFDWIVLTSPSAVRCFMQLLNDQQSDLRKLPQIAVCGDGTAFELKKCGITHDLIPESGFSAAALIHKIKPLISSKTRILRLRSDKAGPQLANELRNAGAIVEDCLLYTNTSIIYETLPNFDAVFFASASAVESFTTQWGQKSLADKTIITIGNPTTETLHAMGVTTNIIVAHEATVHSAIMCLSSHYVAQELKHLDEISQNR